MLQLKPQPQQVIIQPQSVPLPPHVLQKQMRPNSHYATTIRVPYNMQGIISPECLLPNQVVNLQQKPPQVVFSRGAYSVSKTTSVGRPAENTGALPPNSMKIIPMGYPQQVVQRPPSINKRQIPLQVQL
jgi:hypothetical protein